MTAILQAVKNNYPKDKDLEWKIKSYNQECYQYTQKIPIRFTKLNDFNKPYKNKQMNLL